jgi:hypothetical protein
MRVALWMFHGKRGDLGERNTEKLKQQNEKERSHDNSDSRVGERKIGVTIVLCTVGIIHFMSTKTKATHFTTERD